MPRRDPDRYIRSANMQRAQLNGIMIKIAPAMDAEERYHQKRLGLVKYALNEKH